MIGTVIQQGYKLWHSLAFFCRKVGRRRASPFSRIKGEWATSNPDLWEEIRAYQGFLVCEGWQSKAVDWAFYRWFQTCQTPEEGSHRLRVLVEHMALFASPFQQLLIEEETYQGQPQKAVLESLLDRLEFPADLPVDSQVYQTLLAAFYPDSCPASPFWSVFSRLVAQSFPGQELSEPSLLARQIHQFRYLISYQQASWIRKRYGQDRSDWQALQAYLSQLPFWTYELRQSARLHNKICLEKREDDPGFPVNFKVLLFYHTEFILSETGNFALIEEVRGNNWNGPINGASFNYAPSYRAGHRRLDMEPIRPHDPIGRKKLFQALGGRTQAPTRLTVWQARKDRQAWENSYFNSRGAYSSQGRSRSQQVKALSKRFLKG